jgi:hypothetical protein
MVVTMGNTILGDVMLCNKVEFNCCSSETSVNFHHVIVSYKQCWQSDEHTLYSNRKKLFEFALANELRLTNNFRDKSVYKYKFPARGSTSVIDYFTVGKKTWNTVRCRSIGREQCHI